MTTNSKVIVIREATSFFNYKRNSGRFQGTTIRTDGTTDDGAPMSFEEFLEEFAKCAYIEIDSEIRDVIETVYWTLRIEYNA